MANAIASVDALTLSRAAIVGPYDGPVLRIKWPDFNDPANLKRWADGPRIEAIGSELMEGLSFDSNARQYRAELTYTRQGRAQPLVTLKGPDEALLKKQLSLVAAYADLRPDRSVEIVEQMGYPVAFWGSVVGLTAHRHKYTLQLLEVAFNLTASVQQRFKFMFSTTRPVEFSPQIQPMIPTPGHGAWPSGHATEAFLAANLLQALLDASTPATARHPGNGQASREQLQRLAARIAVNRTVAGVHYPVDSAGGRLLGTALAEFIVARATGGKVHARGFNASLFHEPDGAPKDFSLNDPMDHASGYPYTRDPRARAVGEAPLLAWLWQQAKKEWP